MAMRCDGCDEHPDSPLHTTWRAPLAQALTWAWECWFLGGAGRLCVRPSISIQYLLFPT